MHRWCTGDTQFFGHTMHKIFDVMQMIHIFFWWYTISEWLIPTAASPNNTQNECWLILRRNHCFLHLPFQSYSVIQLTLTDSDDGILSESNALVSAFWVSISSSHGRLSALIPKLASSLTPLETSHNGFVRNAQFQIQCAHQSQVQFSQGFSWHYVRLSSHEHKGFFCPSHLAMQWPRCTGVPNWINEVAISSCAGNCSFVSPGRKLNRRQRCIDTSIIFWGYWICTDSADSRSCAACSSTYCDNYYRGGYRQRPELLKYLLGRPLSKKTPEAKQNTSGPWTSLFYIIYIYIFISYINMIFISYFHISFRPPAKSLCRPRCPFLFVRFSSGVQKDLRCHRRAGKLHHTLLKEMEPVKRNSWVSKTVCLQSLFSRQ